MELHIAGKDESQYYYCYGEEKFQREIRKVYRISIHHSYRENGKVKKKQFVLCTVNYYDLAEGWFCLYDYEDKIEEISKKLSVDSEEASQSVKKRMGTIAIVYIIFCNGRKGGLRTWK